MKRLSQIVAIVAVTLFIPITASMPAAAVSTCEIGYTGPDSQNMCTSEVEYQCSVVSENNVTIVNTNTQESTSGQVTNSGNQNGGDSTSGRVTNDNGATFNVTITNGNDVCVAKAVVPATEKPEPETPVTPTTPVKPTQKVTPKALPVTSGSAAPEVVLVTSSIVLTAAIAFAYRRFHL